jgi:hypothetical protein
MRDSLGLSFLRRCCFAASLLAASCGASSAQPMAGQSAVADIPLSAGSSERVLVIVPPRPRAIVILLPGGDGVVGIDAAGRVGHGGNFLVRTRELWAGQGFAVVVMDAPDGRSLIGERHLPAYADAVARAIAYARGRVAAPVWLVGTSQGSIAAASAAARLGPRWVSGLVLTSSVSRLGRSGETVFDADLGAIAVPVLVVADRGDTCAVSPPGDAARIVGALARSSRRQMLVVDSAEIRSVACEAMSPHGYLGIEPAVVQRISDWIAAPQAH